MVCSRNRALQNSKWFCDLLLPINSSVLTTYVFFSTFRDICFCDNQYKQRVEAIFWFFQLIFINLDIGMTCEKLQIAMTNKRWFVISYECIGWVPHKVPLLTTLRGRAISYLRPGPLGPGLPVVAHIPSRSVHLWRGPFAKKWTHQGDRERRKENS